MKAIAGVLLFIICSGAASTQTTGFIRGHVFDDSTRGGIFNVRITLDGTNIIEHSDSSGWFFFTGIPEGNHVLLVYQDVVYAPRIKDVRVRKGDTTLAIIPLIKTLQDEVTIAVDTIRPKVYPYQPPRNVFRGLGDLANVFEKDNMIHNLNMEPELLLVQHDGGGKAEQIFSLGVDAGFGKEMAVMVDNLPVNLPSHGHSQGYADMHFIMPEIIGSMSVASGILRIENGNFGPGGVISIASNNVLKNRISVEGGSHGIVRGFSSYKIPLTLPRTSAVIAGELYYNDNYFDNPQNLKRYNLFGKITVRDSSDHGMFSVWGSSNGSAWTAPGLLPERAVLNGTVNRFGTLDADLGGNTGRHTITAQYTFFPNPQSFWKIDSYVSRYSFRLFSNTTFFKNDYINGDEIEQNDNRMVYGISGTSLNGFGDIPLTLTLGFAGRLDDISNGLWHTQHRKRVKTKSSTDIMEASMGLYAEGSYDITSFSTMMVGFRSDNFFFHLNDPQAGTVEDISGTKWQHIFSPKFAYGFHPTETWVVYFNIGGGFHTNDARVVLRREEKTLARSIRGEIGIQYGFSGPYQLDQVARCNLWVMNLEEELVYLADEATIKEVEAIKNIGISMSIRRELLDWLVGNISATVTRARYKNLTEEENYVPFIPTLMFKAQLHALVTEDIGTGVYFRVIGERPANENNTEQAEGYALVDAEISYAYKQCGFTLMCENLFNSEWNEAYYYNESQLQGESFPVSDLLFTAGTPLSLRAKVTVQF